MITLDVHLIQHERDADGDCVCGATMFSTEEHAEHVADTWREARTVQTVEELDALPVGTILRCGYGRVWEKLAGHRRFSGMEVGKDLGVPALVVWTPEDGAA